MLTHTPRPSYLGVGGLTGLRPLAPTPKKKTTKVGAFVFYVGFECEFEFEFEFDIDFEVNVEAELKFDLEFERELNGSRLF